MDFVRSHLGMMQLWQLLAHFFSRSVTSYKIHISVGFLLLKMPWTCARGHWMLQLKLRYFEEATKFEKIPTCFYTYSALHQNKWEISKNKCWPFQITWPLTNCTKLPMCNEWSKYNIRKLNRYLSTYLFSLLPTGSVNQFLIYESEFHEFFDQLEQFLKVWFVWLSNIVIFV